MIQIESYYYFDKNNPKDMEEAIYTAVKFIKEGIEFQFIEFQLNGKNKDIIYCEITAIED